MSAQPNPADAASGATLAFDRPQGPSRRAPAPGVTVGSCAGIAATEPVVCYACGSQRATHFMDAQDDLTGKPGRFRFVRCEDCALVYQNPRIAADRIADWYDDEYIAHRKKSDFGLLTPLYRWAMDRHDRRKAALVRRYVVLDASSRVLDLGCGAGTFLARVKATTGAHATGVDFKDLSGLPWMNAIDFRCGRPQEQRFDRPFDLITLWHFLEHDYQPQATLAQARDWLAQRGRMVIEVPRLDSVSFRAFGNRWPGLQAPQHTVLYSRGTLLAMVERAGLEVIEWLPWGAFPAYFYLFAGVAFKLLRGRGLDLGRAVGPYFVGEALAAPLLLFEKQLNLAMQTVVVARRGGQ